MLGSKIYLPYAKPLSLPLEQRLRTFVGEHSPATIGLVRSGDGELAVIETTTPEEAQKLAAALTAGNFGTEAPAAVLGSTPQGRDLERQYTAFKQRELEHNWTNRQW
jgi:hypothetical protein